MELKSSFESAGINQTRHQIYMEIRTSAYSYLTGMSSTTEVSTDVAVAETVIVGEVPQMFANLGGLSETLTQAAQGTASQAG